tara:strand:- start:31 stop:477 length:447 start_codon:yes stop_codon:yes gene_type:complete
LAVSVSRNAEDNPAIGTGNWGHNACHTQSVKTAFLYTTVAAKRASEASQHSPFLFPRYYDDKGCQANSASAAPNKLLKQTIGDGYVMHSFSHSMRDRLRAVKCPSKMIDQIGRWSKRSLGEGYGEGFKQEGLANVLNKTANVQPAIFR